MIGQNYQNLLIQIYSKYNKWFYFFIIILVYLLRISFVSANTGINPQIPYSGSIIKNDGTALSDGSYKAKFLIYNVSSGGTAIYEEIRDGSTLYSGITSPSLSVNDGKFEILLGSQNTTNFTSILNDDTLYLELQLDMDSNGSYEEVFSPRRRLGSAVSAINSLRLVAANGGTDTDTLSLDVTGNVIATSLSGGANITTPGGFDRVLLADINGRFSQVALSSISGGSGWALTGNNTTDAWNGSSGTRLGTTSAQPLILATTNATAQDIRFFTGANGANERMRILGTGNVGIGTTSPSFTLDVNGNIRAERYRGINSLVLNTYTTVNPSSNVFLYSQTNDRDSWIYLDSADTGSNWGIYHRQIDSTVSNLPANSIGFIGGGSNTLQSYISLTNGNAYFAGNVGIGTTAPTAKLNLAAGTATANTAPVKFTSGTNLTTPEAGALEWNGTNLFLTNSGNTRQTINQGLTATVTLDFPGTANDIHRDLAVTVTGASPGDVVSLGIPNESIPTLACNFTAWVYAPNTVVVRFSNHSGVSVDPGMGTFKIFVTKF